MPLKTSFQNCHDEICSVSIAYQGFAATAKIECPACSYKSEWSGSPIVYTRKKSKKEKLRAVNLDLVSSFCVTGRGYAVRFYKD